MRSVEIDEETYDLIMFVARAAGTTPGAVVARAVGALRAEPSPAPPASASPSGPEREIYAIYRGEEVRATYLAATRRVAITSGTLAGRVFRTPSAAASAVIGALNPGREMSRVSGMRFWRDAATGQRLEAVAAPPGGPPGP